MGRFLSADSINYLDPESLGGLNLYSYCNNNPVMYVDPSGKIGKAFWIGCAITVGVFILAGAIYGGVSAAVHHENVWIGIRNGAAVGAMMGLSLVAIGLGVGHSAFAKKIYGATAIGVGVGSLVGLCNAVNSHSGGWGSLDIRNVIGSWLIGGVVGGVAAATSYGLAQWGKALGNIMGLDLAGKYFFGKPMADVISSGILTGAGTKLGGLIGGFLGGKLVNYVAQGLQVQNYEVPMWLISILKFLWEWV